MFSAMRVFLSLWEPTLWAMACLGGMGAIAHRGGLLQKIHPLNAVQNFKGPDAQRDVDRGQTPLLYVIQILQSIGISFVGSALQRVDKRLTK